MSNDYISREALKRDLIDKKNFYPAIVARAIEEAPAADVAPVVHGEWEFEHETWGKMRCSECKEEASEKRIFDEKSQWHLEYVCSAYCPNCGAKMDGGKHG